MTSEEFQDLFKDIRDKIVAIIKQNVDLGSTVVFRRDVFDDDEETWLGRLAAPDGSIHCWSVFYTGCAGLDDPENPTATETFIPTFRVIGYRAYSFGTDASNSSDDHVDEVNRLRFAFMETPRLGLVEVESHSGFIDQTVFGKIDTKPIHITRVDMGVQLTPIPYDYLPE